MKHTGIAALGEISELLDQIRTRDTLKEKKFRIFHIKSKSFLHFHIGLQAMGSAPRAIYRSLEPFQQAGLGALLGRVLLWTAVRRRRFPSSAGARQDCRITDPAMK